MDGIDLHDPQDINQDMDEDIRQNRHQDMHQDMHQHMHQNMHQDNYQNMDANMKMAIESCKNKCALCEISSWKNLNAAHVYPYTSTKMAYDNNFFLGETGILAMLDKQSMNNPLHGCNAYCSICKRITWLCTAHTDNCITKYNETLNSMVMTHITEKTRVQEIMQSMQIARKFNTGHK
jgi:hypothetical protein